MNEGKITNILRGYFEDVKSERRLKEDEWISNIRQYKRQYDPDILSKIREYGGSEVYPNYTRSKVKPTIAKINSIFFPPRSSRNAWDLEVSKYQKYPQDLFDAINAKLANIPNPDETTIKTLIQQEINNRKSKAFEIMSEQLTQMKFEDKFKFVNRSVVIYGTGILKGILTASEKRYRTVYNPTTKTVEQVEEEVYYPYIEYVPVWNIYPDMSTYDPDKISYVFELHKMSKKELLLLTEDDGFDTQKIRKYIQDNPEGDYEKPVWEQELEDLSAEGEKNLSIIGTYELLEYWGYVDGHLLDEEKYNPTDSVMVNLWILGDKIIKYDEYDLNTPTDVYHFYYYEKDDSSIFGEGLPSILKGTQLTICAAARMIIDNGTTVAGDQLEVNIDLLSPEQDISSYYPRKIWYREGRGQEAQYPAIRPISFNSHIPEYVSIINLFKQFGDEESNLPAFIWGGTEGLPSTTTATGMTQLSTNTNMTIADIVKSLETENIKLLEQLLRWNREYNPNNQDAFSLKYIIKGFGYEAQAYKEHLLQALAQFNNSISPDDAVYINKYALYKHELKLLGIPFDDILYTEEEVAQRMQAQEDPEAIELAKAKEAADIEYTKAKATHMLAKSKATLDKDELNTILQNRGG